MRDTVDQIVLEKLLQSLPRQASTQVRRANPKSSKEAARLAQQYFQDLRSDPDDPKWCRVSEGKEGKRDRGERLDNFRRYGEDRFKRWEDRREGDIPRKEADNQPKNKEDQGEEKHTPLTGSNGERHYGRPQRSWETRKGPQCYECHGWGHTRDRCPSRVLFVKKTQPGPQQKEPWTILGKINGQETADMLLDSGAEVTVLASEVVPPECYTGGQAEVRGVFPRVKLFDLANVTLEVNGWTLDLEVLVAPPGSLRHAALLGRDIPGLEVSVKLPPQEVLQVQTRAAAKKELERQKQDDKATREAAADPTPLEDLPELVLEAGDEADRRNEAVTSERETASDPSPIEDILELVQEAEVEEDGVSTQSGHCDPLLAVEPTSEEPENPFSTWEDGAFPLLYKPRRGDDWEQYTKSDVVQLQKVDETLKILWQEAMVGGSYSLPDQR